MSIVEDIVLGGTVSSVYDIGTDHAFLPIWLVTNGICERVAATDIKAGPLKKAMGNIAKHGVAGQIAVYEGDGFCAIPAMEAGSYVIISGVGGILLTEIINRGAEKAKIAGTIALQPMNNVPYLRQWLNENGYRVKYEKLAVEDRRIYNLLFCEYKGISESYTCADYLIGKRFANCSENVYRMYIEKITRRLKKEAEGLSKRMNMEK